MNSLRDFVIVYDEVYTPDECQELIDLYDNNLDKTDYFENEIYKFNQLQLFKAGFNHHANKFMKTVEMYGIDYFERVNLIDFMPDHDFEEPRIKRYDGDAQFRTHIDTVDNISGRRFLIAILYLNDNDGMTVMDMLNIGVTPKAGTMLVFPANWMYPHTGLPTSTEKYILMSSLMYVDSGEKYI
jgi:hypothetical protein